MDPSLVKMKSNRRQIPEHQILCEKEWKAESGWLKQKSEMDLKRCGGVSEERRQSKKHD